MGSLAAPKLCNSSHAAQVAGSLSAPSSGTGKTLPLAAPHRVIIHNFALDCRVRGSAPLLWKIFSRSENMGQSLFTVHSRWNYRFAFIARAAFKQVPSKLKLKLKRASFPLTEFSFSLPLFSNFSFYFSFPLPSRPTQGGAISRSSSHPSNIGKKRDLLTYMQVSAGDERSDGRKLD